MERKVLTSELVTEGHPDKKCDQIVDSILDAFLKDDSKSKLACEVAATTGMVFIFGEITSNAVIDCSKIARDVIRDIGYTSSEIWSDADTCSKITLMGKQSPDISRCASYSSNTDVLGTRDQSMVLEYACNGPP